MKSEAFTWCDFYTTGLATIDDQHHHLVDLINLLLKGMARRNNGEQCDLKRIISDLKDYAKHHFSEEEALMESAGIDRRHVSHHKKSHSRFVEQIDLMCGSFGFLGDKRYPLFEFLTSWLSSHILGEDQSMARQMSLIERGVDPAVAYKTELIPRDPATEALLGALRSLYQLVSKQNESLFNNNKILEERVRARTEDLQSANERLEALSRTDGLLGIANRMYFDQRLEIEWSKSRRNGNQISLLMIDVDYFKSYNDRYGHPKGDECLKKIVDAAKQVIFRPNDLLARYGGEELAVILSDTDQDGALKVGERIIRQVRDLDIPHLGGPGGEIVTVSIGIATKTASVETQSSSLLHEADSALYAAKRGGRNQIHRH